VDAEMQRNAFRSPSLAFQAVYPPETSKTLTGKPFPNGKPKRKQLGFALLLIFFGAGLLFSFPKPFFAEGKMFIQNASLKKKKRTICRWKNILSEISWPPLHFMPTLRML